MLTERRRALNRTLTLVAPDLGRTLEPAPTSSLARRNDTRSRLSQYLREAAIPAPAWAFAVGGVALGLILTGASSPFLSPWFTPFAFLLGLAIPFSIAEARIRRRAAEFGQDYPTMLLATASSVKVGMTPYQALERSTRLLAKNSLVRLEVESLLRNLRSGMSRELAVRGFGRDIRQPDLELFRSAFLLVLENGGRFAPTLGRLAAVSNNRAVLMRSAAVSTASMRMTANVLVCLAPILLLIVSSRSKNFWDTLCSHPTANLLASLGLVVIVGSYVILYRMSNFKP